MMLHTESRAGVAAQPSSPDKQAQQFRSRVLTRLVEFSDSIDFDEYGPHARRSVSVSLAAYLNSWHYHTVEMPWAVFCAMGSQTFERENKDRCEVLTLAALTGGADDLGTRAQQGNVEGFDVLGIDLDKGHVTREQIEARCRELGWEAHVLGSFNDGTTTTSLTWATFDDKGIATPSKFCEWCAEQFGVDPADYHRVTAEQAESYLVDGEGYDAEALGKVTLLGWYDSSGHKDNKTGEWIEAPLEISCKIEHAPLPKTRVFVLLSQRVERQQGESSIAFQRRYETEVYLPIARELSPHIDASCKSIERRWYWRGHRLLVKPKPAKHIVGRPVDYTIVPPVTRSATPRPTAPRGETGGAARDDWRGFLAADAAADLIEGVVDKRDSAIPGVGVDCPFRPSHGASKHTGKLQLFVLNAEMANRLPIVKCQSSTCQSHGHDWEDYLSALFDGYDISNPKYWLRSPAEREWVMPKGDAFIVPSKQIDSALAQMNDLWAVVGIGAKTRYVRFGHDGQPEFFDKTNFCNMYEASKYEVVVSWNKDGTPKEIDHSPFAPLWLSWVGRRQFAAGYGFFPDGKAPEGCHNMWRGLSVTPKRGSWQKLKRHLWENVCQKDRGHFRWLTGWLAHLFQHPEIKPGTHLVLRGKEGVGKSKLGEWIVRALSSNAMTLTSGERLVGRFNAHFESLLFALAEEVFWAGDKKAEGVIKALATANEMDYERKGIDPAPGRNYTRLMIASNEPWVVPAWSGGRRWFVLEVGDDHEKDFAYFAAIDDEMENGGLQAMLYDLLHSPLADAVNVREVPVTEQLIEQRKYSADPKRQWLRDAIERGGFICQDYDDDAADGALEGAIVHLHDDGVSTCARSKVLRSAKPYFDRAGMPASEATVAFWLEKELGDLFKNEGKRLTVKAANGRKLRPRTWEFAPLPDLQAHWLAKYGEDLSESEST